jgi:uncharacterized protein (DUF2267 family)
MSLATFAPIAATLHTTDLCLRDLMEELGWQDRCQAYCALRVVLHALRDRLPVEAVAALGAQLPLLVRGMYYEGWSPSGKPLEESDKEDFLAPIAAALRNAPEVDPERLALAVFKVLLRYATSGEIRDERLCLPPGIRALWLVIAQAHKKPDRATPLGDPPCVVRGPSPCRSL